MPRPRVVKETRRPIEEREPPAEQSLRPHEWLSRESAAAYAAVLSSGQPFDVYLSASAERKIKEHALRGVPGRLEVMGFLLGEVGTWKGKAYTVVKDVGTTELKSTSSKVRFDHRALPRLFHELDSSGFDYILVGWYHSHPGHTCFLSGTDLETQRTMFDQPYHVALVVDPIGRDIKTFRLAPGGYEETTFAIYSTAEQRPQDRKVRTRRLKLRTPTGT